VRAAGFMDRGCIMTYRIDRRPPTADRRPPTADV
jgi:hypothetical protein